MSYANIMTCSIGMFLVLIILIKSLKAYQQFMLTGRTGPFELFKFDN